MFNRVGPGAASRPARPALPTSPLGGAASFEKRDINRDGVLTGTEKLGLDKFDGNKDGKITKEEFLEGNKAELSSILGRIRERQNPQFSARDINADGILSGTETKGIEHYDSDKDGKISKGEFAQGRKADAAAARDKALEVEFAVRDINEDGVLSGNEIRTDRTNNELKYDTDKNGEISKSEFMEGKRKRADDLIASLGEEFNRIFKRPALGPALGPDPEPVGAGGGGGGGRVTVR
ncbi:MAG: hypothetical protein VKO64_03810 [Candidatus Sericytochromatia bacterium]|nr:hypothetical protein [Candidatus Sericytochromatia bacterium]